MWLRSATTSWFEVFRRSKVERFSSHFLDMRVVQACIEWQPPAWVPPSLKGRRESRVGRVLRCVVPYHPALTGLGYVIRNYLEAQRSLLSRIGLELEIGISFKNGGKPLFSLVRRAGKGLETY